MKLFTYISLICLLASCGTTRHSLVTTSAVKDSTSKQSIQVVHDIVTHTIETKVHDTVIVVSGHTTELNVKAEDLQPLYNKAGIKKPQVYRKDTVGIHILAVLDTFGNLKVKVNTDTLQFLVENLVYQNEVLQSKNDSMCAVAQIKLHSSDTAVKESTVKTITSVWMRIAEIAGIIILIAALLLFIYKKIKSTYRGGL
ncbi:MAG: hypothetical protein H0X33_14490 [Taibaiella sp.]|nr:hypothetical protein [Taibaiella sp.]